MSAWDTPRTRAFVERLVAPREGLYSVGVEAFEGPLSVGESTQALGAEVEADPAVEGVHARFHWEEGDQLEMVPVGVRMGLNDVQKPFHLWNVERAEHKESMAFEPGPEWKVGAVADEGEVRGMPKRIPKSTAALIRWIGDQDMEAMRAAMAKRRFRQLLRQPLPFGRSEESDDAEPGLASSDAGGFSGGFGGPPGPGGFTGGFGPPGGPPGPGGFTGGFGPPGGPPGPGGFTGGFGPPGGPPDENGFRGGF